MFYNLITILGPTATGKTRLAALLAHHFNGEIISADSRQVYKFMDIGTGKDLKDYLVEGASVKYHLIDIADPAEEFNLFRFKKEFMSCYEKIGEMDFVPFLVGGTGMYLSSVIQNYDLRKADESLKVLDYLNSLDEIELIKILKSKKSRLHNSTDLTDKNRIIQAIIVADSKNPFAVNEKIFSLTIGIRQSREMIKKNITERLEKRLKTGMIEEVESLLARGITIERLNQLGLEYKFIGQYIDGKLNYNDMYQKLNSAIHNFAKRQMTWFRKMEKEGLEVFWIEGNNFEKAKNLINEKYFGRNS